MKKTISSEMTPIYKFLFPAVFCVGFGHVTLSMFLDDQPHKWGIFTIWLLVTLFLAPTTVPLKQIEIEGTDLVISNFIRTIRVPVSQIENVTENCMCNINPVQIHFRKPTDFGTKITFMPTALMFTFYSSHPIVSELMSLAESMDSNSGPPPLPKSL